MNRKLISILSVIATILLSTAVLVVPSSSADRDVASDADEVRLQIYGNANGDDCIDSHDLDVLREIIDSGSKDWAGVHPFADADQDGNIDSDDLEIVQKIISGEDTRMYYLNRYDFVSYVNYPLGTNIMCSNMTHPLLYVTGMFKNLVAIDQSELNYMGKYEGWDRYYVVPNLAAEHTLESLATARAHGVDTFIQWTGGGGSNYLWEMEGIDNIASDMSIVTVDIMGPECIKGALMFAQMLGDITLADDYREWYDSALDRFSIIGTQVDKKTILAMQCFENSEPGSYRAYGSNMAPAYWFNTVIDFIEPCAGRESILGINSFEEMLILATDEIILMTQRETVDKEDYDDAIKEKMTLIYGSTDQFLSGHIYAIDWDAMPYFSGPAGCYILAAYLYPDYFNLDDALDFLQTYLDLFVPDDDADARVGYTYTSAQAMESIPSSDSEGEADNDGIFIYTIIIVAIAAILISILFIRSHR